MADGMLSGDYSQLYSSSDPLSDSDQVLEGFGRTWLGQVFGLNAGQDVRDWQRDQAAANNDFYRNLQLLQEQNIFNSAEAQKNRDFQERMSNTAYQRAMQDMKTAGLNPILAYQQGGASSPSGSSASSGSGGSSRSSRSKTVSNDGLSFLSDLFKSVAGLIKSV